MQILFNRDFKTRDDLDSFIRKNVGDNIDKNREADHTIEGTADELKSLGLSENTTIYGVSVVTKIEEAPADLKPIA